MSANRACIDCMLPRKYTTFSGWYFLTSFDEIILNNIQIYCFHNDKIEAQVLIQHSTHIVHERTQIKERDVYISYTECHENECK